MRRWALLPILLLVFAVAEVGAHAVTRARVPAKGDWQAASRFVRTQWQPRDLIVAAPTWADPLVREVLGDRIDLAMAGRSDLAPYERMWALSIRGQQPEEAQARTASEQRAFGGVRVLRFDLGKSPVRYDFVQHARDAQVSVVAKGLERRCEFGRQSAPRNGGLGVGVLPPRARFDCAPTRGIWVAPVVLEDLNIRARYCIYAPPPAGKTLRLRFPDVALHDRIVVYGGLYYEHERMREGGPVDLRVVIQGHEKARMTHRDGDGYKRIEVPTQPGRAEVIFEVSASDPRKRSFCFAASVREGPERSP